MEGILRYGRKLRINVKALWLAARAWKATREIRATQRRVLEQHRKNEETLRGTK